ncbi:hypothetical protein [Allonocardiopsis opalescens]|uniref:Uncharacterized protein n=1 Tax=Allonocardiopsis opalescens TaxID=1144618 RepID=A0A2T0QF94_9ACTN|nr:hypothetical protein [Allonocardiopsis opalescens]PRY02607.1 hypothetical protein CLV72_1011210 [Allonocardiopsis opalescens]
MLDHPTTRRALLGGALAAGSAAALSGCDAGFLWNPPVEPDPDAAVLDAAVATTLAAIGHYEAALAAGGGDTDRFTAFLANHRAHLVELRRRLPPPTDDMPPPPAATAAPPAVDPAQASTGRLRELEEEAARARLEQLERSSAPRLGQLLASIGACEAAQASRLGGDL